MAKKTYFEPVDLKVSFPETEKKLLEEWYGRGLVKKYLQKNQASRVRFSFFDGPITANNPMGVHHAWGRTYKDLWQRFKNMQGFAQRFQNGFDCQGLWVEVEVEKELGFKSKKDIETYGIANFVNRCKERVLKYSTIQTEQSKRLGYFMDWENSYFTMSDENNYTIWHFLKTCYERGWIYKGHDSVPWCPRCETAISQHEMLTEDYKELTHESVILKFPIKNRKDEYLLVWTTTPWTIPANIAVAVDEEIDYSLVEGKDGKKYWVARELAESIFKEGYEKIIKTVKGKELVGLKYAGAFDQLEAVKKVSHKKGFHTVIPTDPLIMPISVTEGTGLVHTAVSAGEEDFRLGKKLGLPMIPVIADNADYLPGLGELSGKNAKKDPHIILDGLGDFAFAIFPYTHRYPACWRCKTELVWKVADVWYIAMDLPSHEASVGKQTLREQMIEVAKKINWLPNFGLERELDWLKNMHDWLISKKNRYWGLALPIYECQECGNFEVLGSREELKERAVEGWEKFEGNTPHRPWIDEVKIKCSKCGGKVSRILDVGNPWLDAGIISFSTLDYLHNKDYWEKWFPADFITESFPGQFKNWFYSLIAMSTVLAKSPPTKTILGHGTLLGEDGRPMHKSWGNAIEFNEGADKIGVDVMRWMYVRQNPTENLLFGYRVADEVRRRFHLKLWNIYNFFVTYANLDGWTPPSGNSSLPSTSSVLDKWILARLTQTIAKVTKFLEAYDAYTASGAIEALVDDMSLWYIRRSRDRVGPAAESPKDKEDFYETTYYLLVVLAKLLAPFTPFVAEMMYLNLTKEESVHLSEWPDVVLKLKNQDTNLLEEMAHAREVVELAHAQRKLAQIPVKVPLQLIKVASPKEKPQEEVLKILKEELNIKEVDWKAGETLALEIDTEITPELEEEAKARELIRKIQEERKKMGLSLSERITVFSPWIPADKSLKAWIVRKTLADKIESGDFAIKKV
jgi:isoleucyl-tRNA synthetase